MNKRTLASMAFFLTLIFANSAELEVGSPAPDLQATNQHGEKIDLSSSFDDGISLVFFYPKADTPGCTKQACSLRDSFEELTAKNVKIYGVSYDSPEEQKAFIDKFSLTYDLIADEDKQVSKAFGRDGYSRQAYLIKDGILIWRDLKASTQQQAADVKMALTELGLLTFSSLE